jgi:hypothetical protein
LQKHPGEAQLRVPPSHEDSWQELFNRSYNDYFKR